MRVTPEWGSNHSDSLQSVRLAEDEKKCRQPPAREALFARAHNDFVLLDCMRIEPKFSFNAEIKKLFSFQSNDG
jgi:hypothetical protein